MDSVQPRRELHAAVRVGLSSAHRTLHSAQGNASVGAATTKRLARPVGFVAGFLDASGGGGWGPVATSWLVGAGLSPRQAIGSVNTAEFFVTVAAATTFLLELGASSVQQLVPLVLGGLFAAPFGGWVAKRVPARGLMFAVGALIVALAVWQLARSFKWV